MLRNYRKYPVLGLIISVDSDYEPHTRKIADFEQWLLNSDRITGLSLEQYWTLPKDGVLRDMELFISGDPYLIAQRDITIITSGDVPMTC